MSQHLPRPPRLPTQAAEGLPRWRWTLAEFDRFIELGILTEEDRVELIGGELVPMAAKGIGHESVRAELQDWLAARLPPPLRVLVELGWRPDDHTYCEPDLLVAARQFKPVSKVPAAETLLLIEVADSTLNSDLTTKAALYSSLGVREYWVVNTFTLTTHVHLGPSPEGYQSIEACKPTVLLKPQSLPEISIRMSDLGIET